MLLAIAMLLAGCAGISPQEEVNALMTEGQQLHSAKKYDEAIVKFREATAKDPANWSAHLWIARSFIAKGSWPDAVASARRAYELAPKGPEVQTVFLQALFGAGTEALAKGNYTDSIRYFTDYLRQQPGNIQAWLNVGKAYMGNRQFADGLNALLKGLGAGAGGAERSEILKTILGGGQQAFSQGDFGSAIALLREYVKLDSRDWSAYLTLAKSYWEAGQRSDALNAFRKVLELNPRHAEALQFLQGR